MTAKQFSVRFLAIFVTFVGTLAGLNYLVNPVGVFPSSFFPAKVDEWRQRKTNFLASDRTNYDLVVLGSSTSNVLDTAYIERTYGLKAYNYSLTCTGTEDYFCQANFMVQQKKMRPRYVLLGVDFMNFRPRGAAEGLKNTSLLYQYIGHDQKMRTLRNLFSVDVTRLSLQVLLGGNEKFALKDALFNAFSRNNKQATVVRRRQVGEAFVYNEAAVRGHSKATFVQTYASYTSLNSEKKDYFEKTLALLQRNGTRVILYSPSLHPIHYRELLTHPVFGRTFAEYRRYMQSVSARYGMPYYDFSDVRTAGIDPLTFEDSVHYSGEEARKLLDRMLRPLANPSHPTHRLLTRE